MPSLFKLLSQSCGLHVNEASDFLESKIDTTKSWWMGRRNPPESVLQKLAELAVKQDIAAQDILLDMGLRDNRNLNRITLRLCESDSQAKAIGWPSANAHRAVIRRVVERMPSNLATRLILISDNRELSLSNGQ